MIACLLFLVFPAVAGEQDPSSLASQLAASSLDPAAARSVGRLKIDAGMGSVLIENGLLFPASAVGGQVREMVFIGDAHFLFKPPDDIERAQLKLFTGTTRLDETFKSGVLVIANDASSAVLLQTSAAGIVNTDAARQARDLYETWKSGPERKASDVEAALLTDAVEEGAYDEYFAAWIHGETLGDFLYSVEPEEPEQVTLAQFVPLDVDKWNARQIARGIKRSQRKGRMRDLEFSDLGDWDEWVRASLTDPSGRPQPGKNGFRAERYTIDVSLARGDLEMTSRATLRLVAEGGRRVVRLHLSSDLQVTKVLREGGKDADKGLFFHQQGGDLLVVLPAPPAAGEKIPLTVEYHGNIIQKIEPSSYALQGTLSWYPSCGELDRSTFDVTYHWPKSLNLVSGGRRVDGGVEDGGAAWERRTIDIPVLGFTFELGHFKMSTAKAGHIDVTLAIDPLTDFNKEISGGEMLEAITGALDYYEQTFGAYPLDYMTVATVPRGFSQGVMSLVTLSTGMLSFEEVFQEVFRIPDQRAIIAHEIAHQWWGNIIGWSGYRDQWISEAMANYASVLYCRNRLKLKDESFRVPTERWRAELESRTERGLTVDELGPVVMGTRLSSSLDDENRAYGTIVYKKGAIVLNMLAQTFQKESDYLTTLKQLVAAARGTTLSTEEFLRLLQRLSGVDFTPFAKEFIFGTGIPDVFYSYEIRKTDAGKWVIKGEAEQKAAYSLHYGLRRTPDGNLDITRTSVERMTLSKSAFVTPVGIKLYRGSATQEGTGGESGGRRDRVQAKLLIRGEKTEFELPLDEEPLEIRLDPANEIYANFYTERLTPKRVAFYKARDLADTGHLEEAETFFKKAVDTQTKGEADLGAAYNKAAQKLESELVDILSHLGLARIYFEEDRLDDASKMIDRAQTTNPQLMRYLRIDLLLLDSRLDLRRGDYDKAYKRLKSKFVGRDKPKDTEAYVMLAIAAKATNNIEDYETARNLALKNGADLSLLLAGD